jgi:hypothetical protein
MRMPSVTELISLVFYDEPGYRLAPALTHGHFMRRVIENHSAEVANRLAPLLCPGSG